MVVCVSDKNLASTNPSSVAATVLLGPKVGRYPKTQPEPEHVVPSVFRREAKGMASHEMSNGVRIPVPLPGDEPVAASGYNPGGKKPTSGGFEAKRKP
jgi:hypothetical protein